jgi:hypothetical protein
MVPLTEKNKDTMNFPSSLIEKHKNTNGYARDRRAMYMQFFLAEKQHKKKRQAMKKKHAKPQ